MLYVPFRLWASSYSRNEANAAAVQLYNWEISMDLCTGPRIGPLPDSVSGEWDELPYFTESIKIEIVCKDEGRHLIRNIINADLGKNEP